MYYSKSKHSHILARFSSSCNFIRGLIFVQISYLIELNEQFLDVYEFYFENSS